MEPYQGVMSILLYLLLHACNLQEIQAESYNAIGTEGIADETRLGQVHFRRKFNRHVELSGRKCMDCSGS